MDADPEGASQSRNRTPGIQVGPVGALQTPKVLLRAAEHVRRGGEKLQIGCSELTHAICCEQRLVGVHPSFSCVAVTSASEISRGLHGSDYRRNCGFARIESWIAQAIL